MTTWLVQDTGLKRLRNKDRDKRGRETHKEKERETETGKGVVIGKPHMFSSTSVAITLHFEKY